MDVRINKVFLSQTVNRFGKNVLMVPIKRFKVEYLSVSLPQSQLFKMK